MLTDKKVSVKNIIARVYQDLGLTEEIDIGTIIEWSADALEKINVYQQLTNKTECLKVCNYKVEIPCDFVYLDEISYNGKAINKNIGTSSLFKRNSYPYYTTPQSVNEEGIKNSTYYYGLKYSFCSKDNFIMQDGYFKTSFCEGDLDIVYRAIPMDSEGFPLIPDEISFKEAIFWYIAYKYFYIKSIKEERFKWFYQDADQKYRYYVNQAGANAMMPDLYTLENIKRNYLTLVPKIHSYKTLFQDLN